MSVCEIATVVEWEAGKSADGWWVRSALDLDGERLENLPVCMGIDFLATQPSDRVVLGRIDGHRVVLGRVWMPVGSAA